jgi:arylformamidase
MDAASFPLQRLVGEAVLLDFRHKQPGEAVTLDELEACAYKIRAGDIVLFNFDCARHYRTARSHDRPTIAHDAIRWLIFDRKINMIGSDASGIELKGVPNQPNHQALMENGIPIIEFAANLDQLRSERFILFVLALAMEGLDSCPVRLMAVEEEPND